MTKYLFAIPLILLASNAFAQQDRDGCVRDVSRFCRKVMNDGDQVVLACLKEHRARLSKACALVLADHGQ
jgi:hypothetical protein